VSREGMVIQNFICQSDVRKIVMFTGTDTDNEQMINQFEDETRCELDILAVITIRADLYLPAEHNLIWICLL
jgi:3-deoxy-D-arabino-heptulosonate 7-phosphate (DAHP) synthase